MVAFLNHYPVPFAAVLLFEVQDGIIRANPGRESRQVEEHEPGSPFVRLNRILAQSFIGNPDEALEALDVLEATGELYNNPALPAARASIYKRNGRLADACVNYTHALALATGPYEKDFFRLKIEQCKF